MGALPDLLVDLKKEAQPGARTVRILLGTSLCHFQRIDGLAKVWRQSDLRAIARARLSDRLGEEAAATMRIGTEKGWGVAALVCGVDMAVIEGISVICAEAACEIVGIRPWLGEALVRRREWVGAARSAFVRERDCLSLIWDQGEAPDVQSLPVHQEMEGKNERALLLAGSGCPETVGSQLTLQLDRLIPRSSGDAQFTDCLQLTVSSS
jgi:hypothetical protein